MEIDFKKIEKKWQKKWEQEKVFVVKEDKKKDKFYVMEMFPYPSALGLHLGHALNYTIGDILARFKRMQGFNVLYPMGFDALGLPAENAAIKAGEHPKPYTEKAIKNYIKQMKNLGLSYDWSKLLSSMEPEYYRWNQLFFLKFLENGLAYRKKAAVNWCPKCNTVLANEQVVGGCCWRHEDTEVEIKHLEQWFLKTTKYADELLDCIDDLQWPEKIKTMQKNWIGKSYGTEIDFEVKNGNSEGKIIMVDAVSCLVDKEGNVNKELKNYLDSLPNKKIVLTNAPFEKHKVYFKNIKDYEIFTLEFNPEKIDINYYRKFLKKFKLEPSEVIYFEHSKEAVESAKKAGIETFYYQNNVKDVINFINKNSTQKFPIFTTRPDTVYGVTFMVISAQHPRLSELVTDEQKKEVEKFLHRSVYPPTLNERAKKIKSTKQEEMDKLDKEGVFTGSYAINPITKGKVPIWVGNFVIADYGSGMVMAVPAHDQRDFEFAKKYGIDIRQVVAKKGNLIRSVVWSTEKDNSELEKIGIQVIETRGQKLNGEMNFVKKIEFDKKLLPVFEKFLAKNLKPYYWCEHVGPDGIFFIFKHSDGKSEKLELTPSTEERINHLMAECFAEKPLKKVPKKSVWRFLASAENNWYLDLIIHTTDGKLINSSQFNGMNNREAIDEITKYLIKKKLGRKSVQFKLRDWLISRQRYWGTPIPVVYCDECGIVPVAEKDLPVKLPEKVKFGKGNPLATNERFVNVKCPKCNGKARRETDTMDTFVDSSWYFMRYPDNKNDKEPFSKKSSEYWLPVDQYIGGVEHATMHLIYARFWTKALRDLGYVNYDEPFTKLFNQGMLHGENGEKMSKSKGNVILPEVVSEKYGIDTARFFLMSLAAPDKAREWSDKGVEGSLKFIRKVMNYFESVKIGKADTKIESKLNKTIKEVTNQIENFKYNLAVIKIRELFNSLPKETSKDVLEKSLKLLHPFCPHITEELWEKIGGSEQARTSSSKDRERNKNLITLAKWPVSDEKKIDESLEKQDEMIKKLNSDMENIKKLTGKSNAKVYVYVLPNELEIYKNIEGIKLFAVNDKKKYDPENKSKKVKLGKPGIYLE